MRKYIVFVSKDHYNPLGIVRTLGEANISPVVVVVKSKPQLVTKSKYVKEKYIVNSPKEGIELIISKFGNEQEKPFILTGDDVTVSILDEYYERLKDHFYFFNAGQSGRVRKFMNKDEICALAAKHGFRIPKTWKVKRGEIPEDLEYPVFTKAVHSFGKEWKNIVFVCKNENELKIAYSKMQSEEIIIQKYIEKIDEQGCEGFSVNRGQDVFFSVWNREAYHLPEQYAPVWYNSNPDNQEFIDKASSMIKEIGFEGIFEFEFMVGQDKQLYFLEINFRNTVNGWETTCAGMPGVTLWCESMLLNRIVDNCYRQIPEGFYTMAECFDYDVRVKGKKLTRRQWLKEYKNANAKLYLGRKDFRPFFSFMWYKLWHMRRSHK
ncbi:MAG: ATP-grasp domain-containing protein [Oscillospiraceae bacterium]|nr:ATP-grasp domain-containing protein [Oscillospiraceae bacterium]